MKVFVGQIYVQQGVNFPFSHKFQQWLGKRITEHVKPSNSFLKRYSVDFDVMFRLSAKAEIQEPEIKGPTVFKKDKDIEFTVFLPHSGGHMANEDEYKGPLKSFLDCIVLALKSLSVDTVDLEENVLYMVQDIVSDGSMFKEPR